MTPNTRRPINQTLCGTPRSGSTSACPPRTCPEYAKVINLLEIFDGDMPVIFYLEDTKQKLAAPRRLYTSGHPLFFQELKRVVGARNVATK